MKIHIKDDLKVLTQNISTVYNTMKNSNSNSTGYIGDSYYQFNKILNEDLSVQECNISNSIYYVIEYGSRISPYSLNNEIRIDEDGNIIKICLVPSSPTLVIIQQNEIDGHINNIIDLPSRTTKMTEEYVFQMSTVQEYYYAIRMIMDLKKNINRKLRVYVPEFSQELIKYI